METYEPCIPLNNPYSNALHTPLNNLLEGVSIMAHMGHEL